jgi:hypothetical protein
MPDIPFERLLAICLFEWPEDEDIVDDGQPNAYKHQNVCGSTEAVLVIQNTSHDGAKYVSQTLASQ